METEIIISCRCCKIYSNSTIFMTKLAVSWFSRLLFFFSSRRRHTRLQGDWSSDVCSSDLGHEDVGGDAEELLAGDFGAVGVAGDRAILLDVLLQTVGVEALRVVQVPRVVRSGERRVGKECRSRGAPDHLKKKIRWIHLSTP